MKFNAECVTCKKLGNCTDTSGQKVMNHYVCFRYEEVERQESVSARCDVINKYGEGGLQALISPNRTIEEA